MNEPAVDLVCQVLAHHPYGPSKLENYDPKSRGCYAFVPNPEASFQAEAGTLKHQATSTRNLELLGGDARAEVEVSRVLEFMDSASQGYSQVERELTLSTDKIFGTLDYLALNLVARKALIIDAKFGAWSVTPARRNLQGWAYVVLTFHTYPALNKVKMIFYAAKAGLHTEATFYRYELPRLEKRIARIQERAALAKENPTPRDYTPDAINCSYCVRINCPARLALMGTLVTQWTGKPIELPHLDLLAITTPQLSVLKRLSNVFKTFSAAVDAEAKRRAFDAGDLIEGYEIVERSGPRTVVGAEQISAASASLSQAWAELGFSPADWANYITNNVELSVGDLEKEIAKIAPRGQIALAKKAIVSALEKAGLINASSVFYLSAIKE